MHVGALLVPHAKSAKLVEPGESSFDNPAPFPQSTAVFCISLCQEGPDPATPQTVADCLGIVSAIAYEAVGTPAWTSTFALQRRNSIDEYQGLLGVMAIGSGQMDCKRNSSAIADDMTLAAPLGSISGVTACLRTPKTARTEQLSTTARDQSILP